MEDSKAARWQRCVNVLVALVKREGIQDIEQVSDAIGVLRPRLRGHFARMKLKKRSRGIISILGLKRAAGRDLYDATLDEDLIGRDPIENDAQREETTMIRKFRKVEFFWAFWRFAIQMYIFAAVLFRICFEIPRDPVSWTLEFLFVDMTSFVTIAYRLFGYRENRGIPYYDPKRTAREYLRSWFVLDLIGAIPFDFIGMGVSADWAKCTIRFNRCGFIAPYWQLNRLLNCRGMFVAFNDVLETVMLKFAIHPYMARVTTSFLNFAFIAHFLACGLFVLFVIYFEDFETVMPGGKRLDQVSASYQYFECYEWATKNLVGLNKGNSFPGHPVQLIYNVMTSLVGVTLFGLLLATIANYVSRPSPDAEFQQDMDQIIDIMNYKRFPEELRDDVLAHMKHKHEARTHLSTFHTALDGLPTELLDRILLKEGLDVLSKVPLFQPHLGNRRFVVNLARMLEPEIHPPEHIMFEKGDPGDAMYFVLRGALGVVDPGDVTVVRFRIGAGGFVGEIALLMDGPRTATVAVVGDRFADVLALRKANFQMLASQFPQIFRAMHATARDRFLELNKDLFENARKLGDSVYSPQAQAFAVTPPPLIGDALGRRTSVSDDNTNLLSPESQPSHGRRGRRMSTGSALSSIASGRPGASRLGAAMERLHQAEEEAAAIDDELLSHVSTLSTPRYRPASSHAFAPPSGSQPRPPSQ
mmetsp:Transcript_9299/g.28814  ORF Transcript_9299/g.28814 Transcript_9299/m.28814 type:complete len:700 (-) Transcript_9299:221-2320(-)